MARNRTPEPGRANAEKLARVAKSDKTFRLEGNLWVGKCLICNGPVAFDARSGQGATVEHIQARSRGGTDDLWNLAVVHASCNAEKGIRWDPKRKRSADDYETLVRRMLEKRQGRMRGESGPGSTDRGPSA